MSPLDWIMIRWIRLRSRVTSARRWRGASGTGVDLGVDRIPGRGEFLAGGLVKCQDLQERFGNDREHPGILYLVSSALPHDADIQMAAAQKGGGRVVLNQNGVGYPGWHGPGWEAFNAPMKKLHALADHVIYQSEFCRQGAVKFLGKREGPWSVLHNPVDTEVFTPAEQVPAEGPVMLLAGTHQFQYRVDAALDTLAALKASLPGARLWIAGRQTWTRADAAEAHVRERAEALGIVDRVELLSTYAQAEAPELMRRAHMLLHTKYNDPCPRLVVEAMACGLPVVFSATGGMPELVPPHAGAGVPGEVDYEQDHPPAGEDLAGAVQKVWASYPAFREGARAHAVAHLDVRGWLDAHTDLFAELGGGV